MHKKWISHSYEVSWALCSSPEQLSTQGATHRLSLISWWLCSLGSFASERKSLRDYMVYWFFKASIENCCKLGFDDNRCLSSHSSGGQSPKSSYWEGWFLQGTLRENLFHASLLVSCASGNPWFSLSCRHTASVSVFTWTSSICISLSLSLCFLLKKTPVIWFRASSKPKISSSYGPWLNYIHNSPPHLFSQIRSPSQVLGLGLGYIFQRTNLAYTVCFIVSPREVHKSTYIPLARANHTAQP